jgi:hypothetical protein
VPKLRQPKSLPKLTEDAPAEPETFTGTQFLNSDGNTKLAKPPQQETSVAKTQILFPLTARPNSSVGAAVI